MDSRKANAILLFEKGHREKQAKANSRRGIVNNDPYIRTQ